MEKVINVLYDIEKKADLIFDRSAEEKMSLFNQYNKDIENLNFQISANTQSHCSTLKQQMDKEVEEELNSLIQTNENALISLNNDFKKNKDKYVKQILGYIIND